MTKLTRRTFLQTGVALGAAGLLAACGGGGAAPAPSSASPVTSTAPKPAASPAASAKPSAGAAKPTIKVKAGEIATVADHAWNQLPIDRGLFKEAGIDFELLDFRDGGTMLKALLAGDIDIYEGGFNNLPIAIGQGAAVRALGGSKPGLDFALYARKDINALEDLLGKPVAVASTGSFLHLLMIALFETKNLDWRKLQFVNVGASGDVFRAVAVGKVAAGPAPINFKPDADKNADMKTLLVFDDVIAEYPRVVFAATTSTIKDKQDLLVRALSAWVRGLRYGVEHVKELTDIGVRDLKLPPDTLDFFFKFEIDHKSMGLNLELSPDASKYVQDINVKAGVQPKTLPFDQVADDSIKTLVLASIGEYGAKK